MTDDEFIDWWNGCAWHKTGKELDAWPREKLEQIKQAQRDLEALASELHWTAAVFDFQDTIGGELLRDYVARMVQKEKLKADAATRIMNEADNKRAAAERECAAIADRLSGAELERDALGAKLEAAREQFVALAADALNARQVIREFMAYVKCGQVPEDAHCVKRAKQVLNASIATSHLEDWAAGARSIQPSDEEKRPSGGIQRQRGEAGHA